jgi:hypothetical protein
VGLASGEGGILSQTPLSGLRQAAEDEIALFRHRRPPFALGMAVPRGPARPESSAATHTTRRTYLREPDGHFTRMWLGRTEWHFVKVALMQLLRPDSAGDEGAAGR